MHRRESLGRGVEGVCRALLELAGRFPEVDFLCPVHPNPGVRGPMQDLLRGPGNITLMAPQAYLPFVRLMQRSTLILTDSGGIQEEAPSLGRPVLVLREVTERPEAVEAGAAVLVGTDAGRIVEETSSLLTDRERYQAMAKAVNPFGDGRAAGRIAAFCANLFQSGGGGGLRVPGCPRGGPSGDDDAD
jgi:UDP-N-acetylglucosamine 2-epimerase (non-hydrolysing)